MRVLERVREVVHRVDAPLVAGVVVGDLADAVDGGVAQVDIGRGHVDLGAEDGLALVVGAGAHFLKLGEVLPDGAVAVRAVLAGRFEVAAVFAKFVLSEVADEGLAGADELQRALVHEIEIVRGVVVVGAPGRNRASARPRGWIRRIPDIFLGGIGVVHAQVALTGVFGGEAEIQADGFGVADVQVAVRPGGQRVDYDRQTVAGFPDRRR